MGEYQFSKITYVYSYQKLRKIYFEMNKFWNVQRLFGVIVSCLREGNRRDNVLAMFWKKGVEIDVLSLSSNHIDILIAIENEDEKWRWYMIITN